MNFEKEFTKKQNIKEFETKERVKTKLSPDVLHIIKNIDMNYIESSTIGQIKTNIENYRTQKINDVFTTAPGIYAWIVDSKIVYIGQAKNIAVRIKQHVKELLDDAAKTAKYNKGILLDDISIAIVWKSHTTDHNILSAAEQVAINLCGGIKNLWNGRNELSPEKLAKVKKLF